MKASKPCREVAVGADCLRTRLHNTMGESTTSRITEAAHPILCIRVERYTSVVLNELYRAIRETSNTATGTDNTTEVEV